MVFVGWWCVRRAIEGFFWGGRNVLYGVLGGVIISVCGC